MAPPRVFAPPPLQPERGAPARTTCPRRHSRVEAELAASRPGISRRLSPRGPPRGVCLADSTPSRSWTSPLKASSLAGAARRPLRCHCSEAAAGGCTTSGDAGTWLPLPGPAHLGPGRPGPLSEARARRDILQDFRSPSQVRFRRKRDSRFWARARERCGKGKQPRGEERAQVPAGPRRPGRGSGGERRVLGYAAAPSRASAGTLSAASQL